MASKSHNILRKSSDFIKSHKISQHVINHRKSDKFPGNGQTATISYSISHKMSLNLAKSENLKLCCESFDMYTLRYFFAHKTMRFPSTGSVFFFFMSMGIIELFVFRIPEQHFRSLSVRVLLKL